MQLGWEGFGRLRCISSFGLLGRFRSTFFFESNAPSTRRQAFVKYALLLGFAASQTCHDLKDKLIREHSQIFVKWFQKFTYKSFTYQFGLVMKLSPSHTMKMWEQYWIWEDIGIFSKILWWWDLLCACGAVESLVVPITTERRRSVTSISAKTIR